MPRMHILDGGERLIDTFILSTGNSPERSSHTQCASHTGTVAGGGTIEVSCSSIARYLSFIRNGGFHFYAATLCEVVVIGHKHISKYKRLCLCIEKYV